MAFKLKGYTPFTKRTLNPFDRHDRTDYHGLGAKGLNKRKTKRVPKRKKPIEGAVATPFKSIAFSMHSASARHRSPGSVKFEIDANRRRRKKEDEMYAEAKVKRKKKRVERKRKRSVKKQRKSMTQGAVKKKK